MEGKDVDPIRKPINQINPSDNSTAMSFGNEGKREDNSALGKENEDLKKEVAELNSKLEAERTQNEETMKKYMESSAKIDELTTLNNTLTEKVKELEAKIGGETA